LKIAAKEEKTRPEALLPAVDVVVHDVLMKPGAATYQLNAFNWKFVA